MGTARSTNLWPTPGLTSINQVREVKDPKLIRKACRLENSVLHWEAPSMVEGIHLSTCKTVRRVEEELFRD